MMGGKAIDTIFFLKLLLPKTFFSHTDGGLELTYQRHGLLFGLFCGVTVDGCVFSDEEGKHYL